ncbi:ATP-binding protein [Labedaea rhizosphaerae]|uniref:STAS domain-containing protein n=1 Tax=Labedaea rhizosphaerae TaxID=598644 RepID=A0A4R6S6W1_LABRH|nr:ATP-binding protein [Labedaea rhizosphaerae]TDP95074.1 hypothetical protein EV186_105306 [Labedaea rhizosphaerae]
MLKIEVSAHGRRTDVTVDGVLSDATAGRLRDDLLKCSTDGPDVLAVDISSLRVESRHLLSVFSVVARRLEEWPGTALVLVCAAPDLRDTLGRIAINRFVRVVGDRAALDTEVGTPQRRRAWLRLPWAKQAPRYAREFVGETCAQWNLPAFTDVATAIVSELVENALVHTTSGPRLRLEFRHGMFTVAVTDDSPVPPVLREAPRTLGLGLHIVAELATTWGSTPTPAGGKVVWAVLTESSLGPRKQPPG